MYHPEKVQNYLEQISRQRSTVEDFLKRSIFLHLLWLIGIPALVYGAAERSVAIFTKIDINVTDVSYCMIALTVLFSWLFMGMAEDQPKSELLRKQNEIHDQKSPTGLNCIAQQSYRLPFPYSCQIYHLLNLKHLEEIHRFSLGNIRITDVSHLCKSQVGGQVQFKTVLNSPLNVLRLWRQSSVNIDLILHSPYQVELKVPAYRQKFIHVLFHVIPLNASEHQLSIQMFSDLQWPRKILRVILLLASHLTLLEDLPYLKKLAKRKRVFPQVDLDEVKSSQTMQMQLFQRYIDLYGRHWQQSQWQW